MLSSPKDPYVQVEGEYRDKLIGVKGEGLCVLINFDEIYNLKGRLLTIVDAAVSDPEQRKAQKDLVWRALREWAEDLFDREGA